MFQIDHLGIAVKSLAVAKSIYEKLGLTVSPEEIVEQEKVRLVMVPVGESRLELLEATSDDSTIAKFIAKHGEGLHHICIRVPDLAVGIYDCVVAFDHVQGRAWLMSTGFPETDRQRRRQRAARRLRELASRLKSAPPELRCPAVHALERGVVRELYRWARVEHREVVGHDIVP